MNEAEALRVLLLRELESAGPQQGALWSASDRDWATRAALDAVGRDASAARFLFERAHQALQRYGPRWPELQVWLGRRVWRAAWAAWAVFGALALGLGIDSLGGGHINLLAPPLWGVMAWNLAVYAVLIVRVPWKPTAQPGWLIRWWQAALAIAPTGKQAPLIALAPVWARASLPQNMARAAMLLHGLAAALALGLIAGLYLRGLVLDYRAGWQSTFLDASSVHAALSFVLAPAVQLTGIEVPGVTALDALRLTATPGVGQGAAPGAAGTDSAAPWIHLLATSLALLVVLPRLLLSLAHAWQARRLAAHVELPLHEPYFQHLLREQRGEVAQVHVVPYAQPPSAQAIAALRSLLVQALGQDVQLGVGQDIAFGAEDQATPERLVPQGTTHALLWFDMVATPEAEHHGRLAAMLADAAAARAAVCLLLVDEAAFAQRFAA
ncbi:MAG: DUF2868 domain-containing protein, partial [Burkholderiaceae bacterium]